MNNMQLTIHYLFIELSVTSFIDMSPCNTPYLKHVLPKAHSQNHIITQRLFFKFVTKLIATLWYKQACSIHSNCFQHWLGISTVNLMCASNMVCYEVTDWWGIQFKTVRWILLCIMLCLSCKLFTGEFSAPKNCTLIVFCTTYWIFLPLAYRMRKEI